jgi:hypothetical protein
MARDKEAILAAIQRAARELGRTPSRGELKRITGVSHYRVLSEFRTLREAIQAAGLKPNPKGKRITTDDLLRDWKRVTKKLGRKPSRSEYTREGKYSAGALTLRFGTWTEVGSQTGKRLSTAKDAEDAKRKKQPKKNISRELTRTTRIVQTERRHPEGQMTRYPDSSRPDEFPDKAIVMQWASSLTQLPAELAGKRRVTEAFAMLIVNTLLGENSNWHLAPRQARFTTEDTEDHREDRDIHASVAPAPSPVCLAPVESFPTLCSSVSSVVNGSSAANEDAPVSTLRPSASSAANGLALGLKPDRPVMGPPFNLSPLANAPINELGVVFLFGVLAGELGFQVDSLQGRFPDCEARRQVHPGKWQRQRIEFEYESKNFALHGHDPAHCDVIVCWRHNWRECPQELEVIELGRVLGGR